MILGRTLNVTKDDKEYLLAHGVIIDQGYFLIPFTCPHLKKHIEGDGVTKFDVTTYCDIYETRPKMCREFDGRRYKNHHLYWVPKVCTMAVKK